MMASRVFIPLLLLSLSTGILFAEETVRHGEKMEECRRLLARLDLARPELAAVKERVSNGDPAAAMRLLNMHFLNRYPKASIKIKVINNVARDADEALHFRFRSRSSPNYFKLHQDFEWNRKPEGVTDHHWLSLFVSLDVLGFLSDMYIKTGDEKYAKGCMEVFEDWNKHCPPGSGAPSWSLATTMMRVAVMIRVFERMLQWPDWPLEAEARFLNSIADHAGIMYEKRGIGNQDATNSGHLMRVAGFMPEFKDANKWFETGFSRVKDRIFVDVLEDGTQKELCSGYHLNAITGYANAARILNAAFTNAVSTEYMKRLEKMYEWCLVMVRPDGSVPQNGDSSGGSLFTYLKEGSQLFNRPDMVYVATKGKQGSAPAFLDAALPVAGYYVLRSGWTSQDDAYLFMDVSRQPVVSHQDYDALHIDLYAYGRDFFPDKGTFTYGGLAHKEAKATTNHTTVAIDGKNQGDVPAVCHAFFSSPEFSFLDGSQEGYKGITHRRQILFVRPAKGVLPYVILIDRITGKGEHRADQYFHFPPGTLKMDNKQMRTQTLFDKGGNLLIAQVRTKGVELQPTETEMHSRQGESVKRPGALFRREAELPLTFVTLLFPYQGKSPPIIEVTEVDSKIDRRVPEGNEVIAVRVTQADIQDLLFAACEPFVAPDTKESSKVRAGLFRTTKTHLNNTK